MCMHGVFMHGCVCMGVCMGCVCMVYACTTIGTPQKRKSDVLSRRRVMLALEVAHAIQNDSHLFSFQ